MNTEKFEYFLYLIGYCSHGNRDVISQLIGKNKEGVNVLKVVEEVRRELDKNLLIKETKEGKEGVLKHYIFECYELNHFFIRHQSNSENDKDFETYINNSVEVLNMVFNEFQLSCIKYGVGFFKICDSLNFDLTIIDSGIAFGHEENLATQQEDKLSLKQIALIFIYDNNQITRKNATQIAKKHGHKSGEKLYQEYSHFSSRANRKGLAETKKKTHNRIELIKSVIPLLSNTGKDSANDEVVILENAYRAEFTL